MKEIFTIEHQDENSRARTVDFASAWQCSNTCFYAGWHKRNGKAITVDDLHG